MRIEECESPPRGYGVAWFDFATKHVVVLPIGVHWLARWARELYWFLGRGPKSSRQSRALVQHLRAGERVGFEKGWRQGFERGFETHAEVCERLLSDEDPDAIARDVIRAREMP